MFQLRKISAECFSKRNNSRPFWLKYYRVKRLPREAAAFIILRKKGLSINLIAEAFGRSTSMVHRIITKNRGLVLNRKDLRKLPRTLKLRLASRMRCFIYKLLPLWEAWILGDGEEPP